MDNLTTTSDMLAERMRTAVVYRRETISVTRGDGPPCVMTRVDVNPCTPLTSPAAAMPAPAEIAMERATTTTHRWSLPVALAVVVIVVQMVRMERSAPSVRYREWASFALVAVGVVLFVRDSVRDVDGRGLGTGVVKLLSFILAGNVLLPAIWQTPSAAPHVVSRSDDAIDIDDEWP